MIDIKRQEYANNRDKVSHCQRFHFKVGLRSRINRDSLILQYMPDRPVANISKWSHLILWLVKKTWSAIADSWQFVVRALKCSVFLSRNRCFVSLSFSLCRNHCNPSSLPCTLLLTWKKELAYLCKGKKTILSLKIP